jgi:hypothetical protein
MSHQCLRWCLRVPTHLDRDPVRWHVLPSDASSSVASSHAVTNRRRRLLERMVASVHGAVPEQSECKRASLVEVVTLSSTSVSADATHASAAPTAAAGAIIPHAEVIKCEHRECTMPAKFVCAKCGSLCRAHDEMVHKIARFENHPAREELPQEDIYAYRGYQYNEQKAEPYPDDELLLSARHVSI